MAFKKLWPSSRRAACLHLTIGTILLVFGVAFVLRVVAFVQLFDGKHSGIRITQSQAAEAHTSEDARPQVVPKILHHVYHNWKEPGNEKLPADYAETRQTCMDQNPGWEFKLWTDRTSAEFIAQEYPTFIKTYESYKYPVQRVDALRYFLVLHFGGIYLDLDNGCQTSLEPLLYYPAWLTDGGQGTLSNNILGARPHHPFWQLVTQQLYDHNINYLLPYIIISYASGQWFLTKMWQTYHAALRPAGPGGENDHRLHQVMMDMRSGAEAWVFFTQGKGGSWNNWDNHIFGWLGNNPALSIPAMLVFLSFAGFGLHMLRRRFWRWRRGYKHVHEVDFA